MSEHSMARMKHSIRWRRLSAATVWQETATDLLLALDPDLTTLLIEHDMDVALPVTDLRWRTASRDDQRRSCRRPRAQRRFLAVGPGRGGVR